MGQNMSYCRYQNTLAALRECEDDFDYPDDLSDEESMARDRLIELMAELVHNYGTRNFGN